jgi:hypothetical protein
VITLFSSICVHPTLHTYSIETASFYRTGNTANGLGREKIFSKTVLVYEYTELFEMIVGVLTTCHTQYT